MSEPLTNTQLKNRLLGAALLVVLAVLLIPLFLGEPKQTRPTRQNIPAGDGSQFQSRIQPLPDPEELAEQKTQDDVSSSNNATGLVLKKFDEVQSQSTVAKSIQAAPALPTKVVKQTPAKKAAPVPDKKLATPLVEKKVVKVLEKTPAKKKPPEQAPVNNSIAATGWVVQAGIFSKKENAESIANVLRSNGHEPRLSEAQTSFGKAMRVWIGPFENKADARALSKKIEQQTGNGGYVAAYPFKS